MAVRVSLEPLMRDLEGLWSEGSLASSLETVRSSVPRVPTSRCGDLLGPQGTQIVPKPFWEVPPDAPGPHTSGLSQAHQNKQQRPQWKWSVRLAAGAKEVWAAGLCAPASPGSCSCDFLQPPLTKLWRAAARLGLEREIVQAARQPPSLEASSQPRGCRTAGLRHVLGSRPGTAWRERISE